MANEESTFSKTFRGYDPEQVDRAITRLRRELVLAKTELDKKTISASELAEQVASLQAELDQVGKPTFSGLGKALVTTLSTAEQQAATLLTQASADAYNLKLTAQREHERAVEEARRASTNIVTEAEARAELLLEEAERDASAVLRNARAEAARIITEAEHESTTIHRQGVTDVARERADMLRELELARAVAERENAELRLILGSHEAHHGGSGVTDEIMELLKINASAAVRREEIERELLAAQAQAVSQTQHYLDEAHQQLQALRARQSEIRRENDELATATHTELSALRTAVDERALSILAEAQQQARTIVEEASVHAAQILADTQNQLASLMSQRDVLTAHLDEIKEVISQAGARRAESVESKKSTRKTTR